MKFIAHRGKTNEALENTIEAFLAAATDKHVEGIECDVYSTTDHEFIIHHDQNFQRLANDERLVMDLSYKDIEQISLEGIGETFYKVPHLVEFLNICKTYKKRPIIEIKKLHDITLLHNLLSLLEDYMDLNPMIISFNLNYLKYLRTLSTIDLYILTTEVTGQLMYDCRVNEINFYINKESITKDLVDTLRNKGFLIGVFTVNDEETLALCKQLSVDYLTTDNL